MTYTDGECVVLFCEAKELRNTSPAIMSRAGFIFVSEDDLGNEPLVGASLNQQREKKRVILQVLCAQYIVEHELDFRKDDRE